MLKILTFIVGFLFLSLPNASAEECVKVRAGIDIGSGTTKMVVARMNVCTNALLEVLAPAPGEKLERTVKFKRNTITAHDGRKVLSDGIIEQGIQALTELKEEAVSYGAEAFSAVATSAFRKVDREQALSVIGWPSAHRRRHVNVLMLSLALLVSIAIDITTNGAAKEVALNSLAHLIPVYP